MGSISLAELNPVLKAKIADAFNNSGLGDFVFMIRFAATDPGSGISQELAQALTQGLSTTSDTDRFEGNPQLPPALTELMAGEARVFQAGILSAMSHGDQLQH